MKITDIKLYGVMSISMKKHRNKYDTMINS